MKPSLVLLHGALGSKKQFAALKPLLSENFDVHDLNFEGHGGRPSSKDFSIQLFAENVMDFLQEHSITTPHFFGYSMGGYVALQIALAQPLKVAGIITLGTKFDWTKEASEKEIKMLNPEKIEEKLPIFAEQLKQEHHPDDWKNLMRKTAAMMAAMGEGKRLYENDLREIAIPVTIGIGAEDKMVTYEESKQAAHQLINGKIEVLQGIPHPINKIAPETISSYIHASFKDLSK